MGFGHELQRPLIAGEMYYGSLCATVNVAELQKGLQSLPLESTICNKL